MSTKKRVIIFGECSFFLIYNILSNYFFNVHTFVLFQHLEGLTKQVEVILEGSLCLPRYFFQVLQSTSVKVNLVLYFNFFQAFPPPPTTLAQVIDLYAGLLP